MIVPVEIQRGPDGRWIARVSELPGVVAYGATADDARRAATVLALRIVADRLERGESMTDALLAAFAALQAALEHTGSNKATRVLSTVVRVTTQLKQQSAALRALTAKSGRSEKR